MTKSTIILCDIDGVIVDAQPVYDMIDKQIEGPIGHLHYKAYDEIAETAEISTAGVELLYSFIKANCDIYFLTARSEAIRAKTEQLLYRLGLLQNPKHLLMRTEDYKVPSTIVKARQIKEVINLTGTIPDLFIDDSLNNCMEAMANGVPVLRVQCLSETTLNII